MPIVIVKAVRLAAASLSPNGLVTGKCSPNLLYLAANERPVAYLFVDGKEWRGTIEQFPTASDWTVRVRLVEPIGSPG